LKKQEAKVISGEQNKTPEIPGLVLAGGKSVRMGHDKGLIQWHAKEQRYHIADLLSTICSDVFISCRGDQMADIPPAYKTLPDTVDGSGPIVALLSAFKKNPDTAWLVTACDLPLLDTDALSYLVSQRDTSCIATTFESSFDGLPEPLITIWEPASYPVLLAHFSDGFSCPRKALIRNQDRVKNLHAPWPEALLNANTPEDAKKVREIISAGQRIV
jgi:molybdopterin-guanine dinucleotide biosynthesis protein A